MDSCLPIRFCEAQWITWRIQKDAELQIWSPEKGHNFCEVIRRQVPVSHWPQLTEWPCSPLTTVGGGFLWLDCTHALGPGSEDCKALACSGQGQQHTSPTAPRGTVPYAGSQRSGPRPSSAKVWLNYLRQVVFLFWISLFLSTKWEGSMIGHDS